PARARRPDDLHQPVLPVPLPPPTQDLRPRLDLPDGARRHPARDQPVGDHPHHPPTGPATTRTRTTTRPTGRRPPTLL
ncbi:MAG: hypothetical protein AVDCRST_MAG57-1612, partial [uncultured Blastococcus sp.]